TFGKQALDRNTREGGQDATAHRRGNLARANEQVAKCESEAAFPQVSRPVKTSFKAVLRPRATVDVRDNGRGLQRARVDGAGRYAQLHFGAYVWLAPHGQLTSHYGGAFPHPTQPVVALFAQSGQPRRFDAVAVVAHDETKVPVVIPDVNVDVSCPSMLKRVADGLRRDLVDLVTGDWMQIARVAFDRHGEALWRNGGRLAHQL